MIANAASVAVWCWTSSLRIGPIPIDDAVIGLRHWQPQIQMGELSTTIENTITDLNNINNHSFLNIMYILNQNYELNFIDVDMCNMLYVFLMWGGLYDLFWRYRQYRPCLRWELVSWFYEPWDDSFQSCTGLLIKISSGIWLMSQVFIWLFIWTNNQINHI